MYKIGLVLAAFVLSAGLASAQVPSVGPGTADVGAAAISQKVIPRTATPAAANNQTAVSCNLCFTCGGDWPVFAGAWNSANFPATERGSGCGGGLGTGFNDHDPFLCCR